MSGKKLGEEQRIGRDPFTLLQVPPENHRSSIAKLRPKEVISYKAHRSSIPLHESCKSNLQKLGLHQVALLGNINIDQNLVAGLVERWCPETHSFHFPFGEIIVTLQDVSCLLGLPIEGKPLTGVTDSSDIWRDKLERLLNTSIPDEAFRMKKSINGKKTCSIRDKSGFTKKFNKVPSGASWEYVDAYTRAFCLDLIGSILLPDNSGDSVPVIYIQFLENLEDPPQYNWGAAVLAHLYRSLCRASCASCKCIYGPLMLLQIWYWTRFSIAPPARKDGTDGPPLGGDDLEARPPFGIKWSGHHSFKDVPHNGIEFYREQYDKLNDLNVVWQPFDEKISLLHPRVQRESGIWLACIPLIHFWIVEDHYPDQVMRQFGLFQVIPPPAPRDWALGEAKAFENQYTELFGCSTDQFPFRYLGIPIHYRKLRNADWKEVVECFENKLSSWKGKFLSTGGHLTLINSVLSSFPMYMFSFFAIPRGVLKKLDYLRSRFY